MKRGDKVRVITSLDEGEIGASFVGYEGIITATYDDGAQVSLSPNETTPEEIMGHLDGLFFEYEELTKAD